MQQLILTNKQQKVFKFIKSMINIKGEAPTVSEIKSEMGVSSPRSVIQYLNSLERKGLILRERYAVRGIKILEQQEYNEDTVEVPIVASAGCDDMSQFAEEGFGDYLCVPRSVLKGFSMEQIVCVRAVGDSMNEAGIDSGDCVLVEMTTEVRGNDLVVAIVDGFAVIKKIEFINNATILHPVSNNPSYRPIIMSRNSKIFGKVIEVIKKQMKSKGEEVEIVPLYLAEDNF